MIGSSLMQSPPQQFFLLQKTVWMIHHCTCEGRINKAMIYTATGARKKFEAISLLGRDSIYGKKMTSCKLKLCKELEHAGIYLRNDVRYMHKQILLYWYACAETSCQLYAIDVKNNGGKRTVCVRATQRVDIYMQIYINRGTPFCESGAHLGSPQLFTFCKYTFDAITCKCFGKCTVVQLECSNRLLNAIFLYRYWSVKVTGYWPHGHAALHT